MKKNTTIFNNVIFNSIVLLSLLFSSSTFCGGTILSKSKKPSLQEDTNLHKILNNGFTCGTVGAVTSLAITGYCQTISKTPINPLLHGLPAALSFVTGFLGGTAQKSLEIWNTTKKEFAINQIKQQNKNQPEQNSKNQQKQNSLEIFLKQQKERKKLSFNIE